MKILLAVQHFPPSYTAGSEWEAYRIAKKLIERGHEVKVICVERIDSGNQQGLTWVDDDYDNVPVRRLFFNLSFAPDSVRWEYDNLWISEHIESFLVEYGPDLFHLISGYLIGGRPVMVAQQLGIPTVVSLMDFWFLCKRISMRRTDGALATLPINPLTCAKCLSGEKRRFLFLNRVMPGLMNLYWRAQTIQIKQIEQRSDFLLNVLNQSDVLISRSIFLRSFFSQAGVDDNKIIFLRQGQDSNGLIKENYEKTVSPVLRLGYLGQIAEQKGIHILIEAFQQFRQEPLSLSIYGNTQTNPAYTDRLRRLIGSNPNIKFAGMYHDREEMNWVYQNLDMVVVPSVWYENSPNVILESFARYTPVLATNLGGMAELINHGENGLLFKLGSVEDLAGQLKRILNEPGLLEKLKNGIETFHSVNDELDELEMIYHKLMLNKKSKIDQSTGV